MAIHEYTGALRSAPIKPLCTKTAANLQGSKGFGIMEARPYQEDTTTDYLPLSTVLEKKLGVGYYNDKAPDQVNT